MTSTLKEIESLLSKISISEKALVLKWVSSELNGFYPGIDKTEGICGGVARITRTRIPIWLLVRQKQLGITEESILSDYNNLKSEDLVNAWNYYRANQAEIDSLISENEVA